MNQKISVSGALAIDPFALCRLLPDIVRPHIIIAVGIFLMSAGGLEPAMLDGSMTGHEVQNHPHSAPVRSAEQFFKSALVP